MIFYKATVEKQMSVDYGNESTSSASDRLIEEIRQGLERVIETVKNYAIAFEALDGMRGRQPLQRSSEDRISLTSRPRRN